MENHGDNCHACILTFASLCHNSVDIVIIITIIRNSQCKAGREQSTPNLSEDASPTIPIFRKKEEKGKTVEEKNGENIFGQ